MHDLIRSPGGAVDLVGLQLPFGEAPQNGEATPGGSSLTALEAPFAEAAFEDEAGVRPLGRRVVPAHPMLRGHRGTRPDLILRWNRITGPGEVDVVLHFHGFSGRKAKMRIDVDKEPYSGLDFADPAGPGPGGRARPTLAILPRGNYAGAQPGRNPQAYDFPALMAPGAVGRLIDDCLALLSRETGFEARRGRLILTAHSGGGAALSRVVGSVDPDEVQMHDAMYQAARPLVDWAKRRIQRELAAPGPVPPSLRVLYNPAAGTQKHSEALARELCPLLAASDAARLRPLFRVERTGVAHMEIPRRYGWRLLADAGRDLPSVRTCPCSWGVAAAGGGASSERAPTNEEAEMERNGVYAQRDSEGAVGEEALAWLDMERSGIDAEFDRFEAEREAAFAEAPWSETEGGSSSENFDSFGWNEGESGGWAAEEELETEAEWRETDGEEEVERGELEAFGEASESPSSPQAYSELLATLFEADPAIAGEAAARAAGAAAFVVGPALRLGSSGPGVETLQRLLGTLGTGVGVDGRFGPATESAVRAFQTRQGLTADGIAGPITKAALVRASGGGGAPSPAPVVPSTPASGLPARIAQVALEELRRWHPPSGGIKETQAAALPILQRYYREGVNLEVGAGELQNEAWQKANPWSAVFVSWVMRTAGAGNSFRYSRAHREYIRAARGNRVNNVVGNPFWAYRATEIAPQIGDLVCAWRGGTAVDYDSIAQPGEWKTHCDIVVDVRSGSIRVVGGNVNQDVGEKTLRTLADGRLDLGGKQARFFAVLSCRGAAAAGGGPLPSPPQQSTPPKPAPQSPNPAARKLQPKEFVAAYRDAARASEAANGVPALVTLGQAALESGWGQKAAGFNFFGIKAKAGDPPGSRQLWRTREVLPHPNGRFPEILSITKRPDGRYDYVVRDWFRAYPDVTAAFMAHGAMLARLPRYAKAFAHKQDAYAFATEVARGGYATDPNYATVLHGAMRTIERAGGP